MAEKHTCAQCGRWVGEDSILFNRREYCSHECYRNSRGDLLALASIKQRDAAIAALKDRALQAMLANSEASDGNALLVEAAQIAAEYKELMK